MIHKFTGSTMRRDVRAVFQALSAAAMLLVMLFALTACQKAPPDEKAMMKSLPKEVTQISVDKTALPMNVKSFRLDKRQTNKNAKTDAAYCTVELENEYYNCVKHILLNYGYYDKGGWMLDKWTETEKPTCRVIANPFDPKREMNDTDYILKNVQEPEFSPDKGLVVLKYEVEEKRKNVTRTGVISCTYTFKDFSWKKSNFDGSKLIDSWDVVGSWSYENEGGNCKCDLLIKSFDQGTMKMTGSAHFFESYFMVSNEEDTFDLAKAKVALGDSPNPCSYEKGIYILLDNETYVFIGENKAVTKYRGQWPPEPELIRK